MKKILRITLVVSMAFLLSACATTRMRQTTSEVKTVETKTYDEQGRVRSVTTESVTLPGEIQLDRVAFNVNPALQLQFLTIDSGQTSAGESIENAILAVGRDHGDLDTADSSSTTVPTEQTVLPLVTTE